MKFAAVSPVRSIAVNFSQQDTGAMDNLLASDCQDQILTRISEVQSGWNVKERRSRQQIGLERLQSLLDLIDPSLQ